MTNFGSVPGRKPSPEWHDNVTSANNPVATSIKSTVQIKRFACAADFTQAIVASKDCFTGHFFLTRLICLISKIPLDNCHNLCFGGQKLGVIDRGWGL